MCCLFILVYLFYTVKDSLKQTIQSAANSYKLQSEYNEYYPDCDYYVPESEKIMNGLDYPQIFEKE